MYTADFNWISLVALIIFALVGALKPSRRQKNHPEPVFTPEPEPESLADWREEEEEYTILENKEDNVFKQSFAEEVPQTDYYRERPRETVSLSEEAEEDAPEKTYFDLRQAVITSEILKRPEF